MRNKERWRELCELAAVEQDSGKMLTLVQEINRLLDEKRNRLLNQSEPIESATDRDSEVEQPKE